MEHWKNKDNDFLCQLSFLSLQWNLLTVDILCSGHLSTADFFLRNGWNDGQTLTTKPLCSGNFIVSTSLQWTSLLCPKSHYPQEMCTRFTFDNVLQFRLSFLRSLLFHFLASLIDFSDPWKCSWLVFQLQKCPKCNGTVIDMDTIKEIYVVRDNHYSFLVRISANQRNRILVHLVDLLLHALQTLANQWLPNYHISITSSNILFWGSFFP